MAEHQGAVDAHAEGEAGVALVVDAARGEHARVDHAAATPLDPALALAGAAVLHGRALAAADEAAQVDLGAGLGEREVRRPEAGVHALAEHRRGEVVEGALEVGHRDALVDDEALDLVEHRAVRGVVLVGAEDAAGRDDVDGRLPGEHRACLHGAGLGAQHEVVLGRLGPEGVLHRARRVVGAEVERVEVEPLGLDERTFRHLPAHRDEDVGDPLGEHRDRVPGSGDLAVPGKGDVHGLLDEHPLLGLDLELGLTLPQCLVDRAPGLADPLAGVLARLGRERADLPVGQRQRRAVAGVLGPHPLELLEIRRAGDRGEGLLTHLAHVLLVERGHLDRVVLGVGAGHRCLSRVWRTRRIGRTGGCAGQSRKCAAPPANRFAPSRIVHCIRTLDNGVSGSV